MRVTLEWTPANDRVDVRPADAPCPIEGYRIIGLIHLPEHQVAALMVVKVEEGEALSPDAFVAGIGCAGELMEHLMSRAMNPPPEEVPSGHRV